MHGLDPQWLAQLARRINQPPRLPRDPLLVGDSVIGSVVSDAFAAVIAQHDFALRHALRQSQTSKGKVWQIASPATQVLQDLAGLLRDAAYGRVAQEWRDEALAVHDQTGKPIALVERGAVRALGIACQGVHLLGYTPDEKIWIQQRAWNKSNDPGLWDTLMGGMVAAADTVERALARETQEEAGLALAQLSNLQRAKAFTLRMPAAEDQGLGYVVERIDWFEALVPDNLIPLNQDGEVAQFRLVKQVELTSMLHQQAFTAEAAMIFALSAGMALGDASAQ